MEERPLFGYHAGHKIRSIAPFKLTAKALNNQFDNNIIASKAQYNYY